MAGGAQAIIQAGLGSSYWRGRADVLLRVKRPSHLRAWSYEVVDCKLALETKAETVLQLCLYSDLVSELQGLEAEYFHVVRPRNSLIADNYATHRHPKVQKWLARHPRLHVYFTPTSSSWLNMVERFFRDLTERALRRGVFRDVEELITATHVVDTSVPSEARYFRTFPPACCETQIFAPSKQKVGRRCDIVGANDRGVRMSAKIHRIEAVSWARMETTTISDRQRTGQLEDVYGGPVIVYNALARREEGTNRGPSVKTTDRFRNRQPPEVPTRVVGGDASGFSLAFLLNQSNESSCADQPRKGHGPR